MIPGKLYKLHIHYTRSNTRILKLGSAELPTSAVQNLLANGGVLIWENQGSFKIVPNLVLHNMKLRYETARSIDALYPRTKPSAKLNEISWEQGIAISPAVVKALLLTPGEELSDDDYLKGSEALWNTTDDGSYGASYYRDRLAPEKELSDSDPATKTTSKDHPHQP